LVEFADFNIIEIKYSPAAPGNFTPFYGATYYDVIYIVFLPIISLGSSNYIFSGSCFQLQSYLLLLTIHTRGSELLAVGVDQPALL
jgi:hypothetical protein